MANNGNSGGRIRGAVGRILKDPRKSSRLVLGLLLAANLVAATAVLHPWGGSEEELLRQRARLQQQLQQQRDAVERLRAVVENMEKARELAGQFLHQNFTDRAVAYSTVISELSRLAEKAGIKPGDHVYTFDAVEGSDDLAMMTINCNYQGSYADLMEFVNAIDRSPRFLTIERLQAQPTQTPGILAVGLRLNAFVRGGAESR